LSKSDLNEPYSSCDTGIQDNRKDSNTAKVNAIAIIFFIIFAPIPELPVPVRLTGSLLTGLIAGLTPGCQEEGKPPNTAWSERLE
jgi:hypothetical protein